MGIDVKSTVIGLNIILFISFIIGIIIAFVVIVFASTEYSSYFNFTNLICIIISFTIFWIIILFCYFNFSKIIDYFANIKFGTLSKNTQKMMNCDQLKNIEKKIDTELTTLRTKLEKKYDYQNYKRKCDEETLNTQTTTDNN